MFRVGPFKGPEMSEMLRGALFWVCPRGGKGVKVRRYE